MTLDLTKPADFGELAYLSARLGADPLLIQSAGGNTSVKADGVMWIKASGTQLAEACDKDIFVPTDVATMRAAIASGAPEADQPARFLLGDHSLRPSIETSLHAVFDQRVVLHVHCVQTLAGAVRQDAEAYFNARLSAFDWCLVPYAKPGAALAQAVQSRLGPATDVAILRNHGLLVAGADLAQAEALLQRVVAALTVPCAAWDMPDLTALTTAAGPGWAVPELWEPVHQLAFGAGRVAQATGGSLYPDHVIFCGVGARTGTAAPPQPETPVILVVPGRGVLLREDANAGARALARCLADVLLRVPGDAELAYLTPEQNAELLDWDAEKYRKALNA